MSCRVQLIMLLAFFAAYNCDTPVESSTEKPLTIDFNKFHKKLEDHSRYGIKAYLEIPDTDILLNSEASHLIAVKLINQTLKDTELFDNWSKKKIMKNINSSFVFADMTEIIGSKIVESRTSLRRFLSSIDQYLYETSVKFSMPSFLRESLEFPSALKCDFLEDRFEKVDMEILLNYENFTQNRISKSDQLTCSMKGTTTLLMMNQTNIATVLSNEENLTKEVLDKVLTVRAELEQGDCAYIPKDISYSLQSEYSWMYSISWKHVDKYLREHECFDRDNKKNSSHITDHKYSLNKEEDMLASHQKTILVHHFAKYIQKFKGKSLNKKQFLVQDEAEVNFKCDGKCQEVLFNIFDLLDTNKDGEFSQEDIDNIDEDRLEKLNTQVGDEMKKLTGGDAYGDLTKMLMQLKELANNAESGSEISKMIQEKSREWYATLEPEQKQQLINDDMGHVVDELLNIYDNPKEKKENKKVKEEIKEESDETVEIEAEENVEMIKPKPKFEKVDFGGGIDLSDEQMDEILKMIELEEQKEKNEKQEL